MFLSFIGFSFLLHLTVIGVATVYNRLTGRKHRSAFQTYNKQGGWFQSATGNAVLSYAILLLVGTYIFSVFLFSLSVGIRYGANEPQIILLKWLFDLFIVSMTAVMLNEFFFVPVGVGFAVMAAVVLAKPFTHQVLQPAWRRAGTVAAMILTMVGVTRMLIIFVLGSSLFAIPVVAGAQILEPGFESTVVGSGFALPTATAFAEDGRIFVAEKNGVVKVIKNGQVLPTPVITLTDINTFGDRGLIGMALDPNFVSNGYLYLSYTYENTPGLNPAAPKTGRIVRVTVVGDQASESSKVVLVGTVGGDATNPSCDNYAVTADCIASDSNSHSVGALTFGPDGKLYASTGDGADFAAVDPRAFRAQNIDSLAGKVLRINPDGTAPTDNPFFDGNVNSNRSKVYAYGFRNQFRLRFNEGTGRLYGGDVGWSDWEEVNEIQPGNNYGWPCREGASDSPYNCTNPTASTDPLYTYPHNSAGAGSIVIGGFGTNDAYPDQYDTSLFIGDYAQQWIKRLVLNPDGSLNAVVDFNLGGVFPVEFNTGTDGTVHYIDIAFGTLNRLTHTSGNRRPVVAVSSDVNAGLAPLSVQFDTTGTFDPDGDAITYAWTFGDGASSTVANPSHTYTTDGVYNAAVTVTDSFGASVAQSVDITVGNQAPSASIISPASGSLYTPQQSVMVMGDGIDPEDGTLPASAFDWTVILHHNTHTHTVQQFSGTKMITFVADDHQALDVYMEIVLQVTDSTGLTDTQSINMYLNNGGGSGNLISNPSLENADPVIASQPLNWIPGWYGNMNPVFEYPVNGLSGQRAARLTVSNYTFGAARWYFAPVFVTPGETYEFSHLYTAGTSTSLTIQYTRPDGSYLYNFLGILPAANDPTTTNYDIVIPDGVETMTIFHDMFKNGTVTVDEYSLLLKQPTDTNPPTGTIVNITDNQVLSGVVPIEVDAQDAEGPVTQVHLYVDGSKYGALEATSSPFILYWDTTEVADGTYVIRGHIHDQVDNHGLTPEVTVVVANGSTSPNLLSNGDFEQAAGTSPLDWAPAGWGSHTRVYNYPVAGRTGGAAAEVRITSYLFSDTGDAKWAHTPIPVTPGTRYSFSTYYKSDTISDVIAQYTMADGSFVYQGIVKEIQPATDWTYTSGSTIAPDNAVSMRPFHLISAEGYLVIDDVVITASSTGNTSETNPPIVEFISHTEGDTVNGTVTFVASSTDDTQVVGVYFALNGNPVGLEDFTAPYEVTVDTTAYADGVYLLKATTHDIFGNNATANINITIDNSGTTTGTTTPPAATNRVANGDLESGSANNPTNWNQGGWGTNNRAYSYPVAGVSGNAARIDVTAYTSGDAKWYFDDVTVTGGETIPFSHWYRSNVATELVARFTSGSGAVTYQFLRSLPASPATWTEDTLDITVPASAVSMTLFHNIAAVGFLEIDSFALGGSGTTTPPADTEAPVVVLTSPLQGDTISGIVPINFTATDNVGIEFVQLWIDGQVAQTDNTAPFTFTLDTTAYADGQLGIYLEAQDTSGNEGNSDQIFVTVDNASTTPTTDTENPIISFFGEYINGGVFVSDSFVSTVGATGTLDIEYTATDNVGVVLVEIYVNDVLLDALSAAPYRFIVDYTGLPDGLNTVVAYAYDAAGNVGLEGNTFRKDSNLIPPTGNNLITNGDLELGSTNNPTGWGQGGWGTNNRIFTYPVPGATGNGARVEVTSYSSGDAKWYFAPVAITPGADYSFVHSYQANVPTSLVAQYTLTDGSFQYAFISSLPAAASWTTNSGTFTAPANAEFVTLFHNVTSVGYLEVDTWALYGAAGTTTVDTVAPTVDITNYSDNDVVSGTIVIAGTATDNVGVTAVRFEMDGSTYATDTTVPYEFTLDTTTFANGTYSVRLDAEDASGNVGQSDEILIVIANSVSTTTGPNLIANGDIESGIAGTPDNWFEGGWGTNDRVLTHPVPGESGDGLRTEITSYSSGDAKWYFGDMAVTPGATYTFARSYQSNTTTAVVVRYTLTGGSFQYVGLGSAPASATWTQDSYTITPPANATSLTVFQNLNSVGYLEIDNVSLTEN